MIEKLLENWLDRASERSYQPVFVQMLAGDGYKILHSTRHCLLEFGKDVLAIAPDGVGCAFQLKGNPSGRLSVGEFRREIQPQLVQLMGQAPSYPGFPPGPHRSYLVSNGQFEEEVQAAVREMNFSPYPSKVELWGRGQLLSMCTRNADRLWPDEVEDTRVLLELYMLDPRGKPPVQLLDRMLASILKLEEGHESYNRSELVRASTSAAWVTGIAMSSFAEARNHYSVAIAWTQCCVALLGAAVKHASGNLSIVQSSLKLAEAATLDALTALWQEVEGRKSLVEGDPLSDHDIVGWRITTLYGLLTPLAIANADQHLINAPSAEALHRWLMNAENRPSLWGEGAVAALVPWCVWLRKVVATTRPDEEIQALASAVIRANQPRSSSALPSPYYDGEAAMSMSMGLRENATSQPESFHGNSYTACAAMHLLVRTRLKQACKRLWPDFTRLGHRFIDLADEVDYCRFKVRRGVETTKLFPFTYEWSQLQTDTLAEPSCRRMPDALALNPWLLAMWWQAAPHRLNAEAARAFCESLLPGWGS